MKRAGSHLVAALAVIAIASEGIRMQGGRSDGSVREQPRIDLVAESE
jgi:hypothetical protein